MKSVAADSATDTFEASVVIVSFNAAETIESCINSIPTSFEIVLVDQCSWDRSIERAVQTGRNVRVIRAGANRGFGAGCNLGAANARSDVLIFLNPDAAFLGDAALLLVERVRDTHGLVGPTFVDLAGQNTTRILHSSTVVRECFEAALPAAWIPRFVSKVKCSGNATRNSGGEVPYVLGACMAVRREAFLEVGGFDERYFIYHEEEVLSEKLRHIGVPTLFEPRATVAHVGGAATRNVHLFAAEQYYRARGIAYGDRGRVPGLAMLLLLFASLLIGMGLAKVRNSFAFLPSTGYGPEWYAAGIKGIRRGYLGIQVVPPRAPANIERNAE